MQSGFWRVAQGVGAVLSAIIGLTFAANVDLPMWGALAWLTAGSFLLAALILSPLPRLILGGRWTASLLGAWLLTPATLLAGAGLGLALMVHGETLSNSKEPADIDTARRLLAMGDSLGLTFAAAERGQLAHIKKDDDADMWLQRGAEAGSVDAYIGLMQIANDRAEADKAAGVEPYYDEMLGWAAKAARARHCEGITTLGVMFERGMGVPASQSKATDLYRLGEMRSCTRAIAHLGSLQLDEGPQDRADTRALLKRAAEAGEPLGELNYGYMLINGLGGSRDRPAGRAMLEKASAGKDESVAKAARAILAKIGARS